MVCFSFGAARESVADAKRCRTFIGLNTQIDVGAEFARKFAGELVADAVEVAEFRLLFGISELRDERQISLRTDIPAGSSHNVASNRNTDRQLESIGGIRCVAPYFLTVYFRVVAAGLGPHITQSCVRNHVCLAYRQSGFGSSAETE